MESPKAYALLVGIDSYLRPQSQSSVRTNSCGETVTYEDLRGCCNDVSDIENYIKKLYSDPDIDITILTSPSPAHCAHPIDGSGQPPIYQADYPTRERIVEELVRISNKKDDGGLFYFHFSGHGILREAMPTTDTGHSKGGDRRSGAALATVDVMTGGPYLTAFELGEHVRHMVESKKMRATVTLDCCHSGRGLRDKLPGRIRTSDCPFDDSDWRGKDTEALVYAQTINGYTESQTATQRGRTKILPDWLFDLDATSGCTVFTACDFDEFTFETSRLSNARGIFSFSLHSALHEHEGPPAPHSLLHSHVQKALQKWRLRPQLFGNSNYQFFGDRKALERNLVTISDRDNEDPENMVTLAIGTAQSVRRGAIYELHDSRGQSSSTMAEVTSVSAFSCNLEATRDAGSQSSFTAATLYRWALTRTWRVELSALGAYPNLQKSLRKKMKEVPQLSACDDEDTNKAADFFVIPNDHDMFEIQCRGCKSIPEVLGRLMPCIPVSDDIEEGRKLGHILQQMSRYLDILELSEGPLADLGGNVAFHLEGRGNGNVRFRGLIKPEDGVYNVQDGESLGLQVTYNGQSGDMRMAIFYFNASWGIERVWPERGNSHQMVAAQRGQGLPDGQDRFIVELPKDWNSQSSAVDIVRVYFVERLNTTWDDIVLSPLEADTTHLHADSDFRPKEYSRDSRPIRNRRRDGEQHPWGFIDLKIRISPTLPGESPKT